MQTSMHIMVRRSTSAEGVLCKSKEIVLLHFVSIGTACVTIFDSCHENMHAWVFATASWTLKQEDKLSAPTGCKKEHQPYRGNMLMQQHAA